MKKYNNHNLTIMRLTFLALIIVALIGSSACRKDETKNADEFLIEAIKKSTNKQSIDFRDLPTQSKSVLTTDYSDNYINESKIAPELGYEIDMRVERGEKFGEYSQAYFDISGRELKAGKDGKGDKGGKGCFEFVYPVTYILPDESQVIVNSKDDKEAWETIKAWYAENPDVSQRPVIDYPIDIKWKNGEITTINNRDEMKRAKKKCDGDKEKCFELDYPVTYIMLDESEIIVITNDEEGWADIKEWYTAHPDAQKRPSVKYPVSITFKDGNQVTINNDKEMKRAYKDCD